MTRKRCSSVVLIRGDSFSLVDQHESHEKNVDLDAYLSSSSTSLSDLAPEHQTQPIDLAATATNIKKKRTKSHVYDTISKFLLKNRFYLTALEFYTELLENGYDLPRLREYFSNPANFEGTSAVSYNRQSSFIRNLNHYGDDSVSLGGGAGGTGDYLFRTSSSQNFDSTSIDNVTRYSEDIEWTNGASSAGAMTSASGIGEQRFNDERVAVLEFELRKARDTIHELRQTLTFDSTEEQQQPHSKKSEERNGKYQGERWCIVFSLNDLLFLSSTAFLDINPTDDSVPSPGASIRASNIELSDQWVSPDEQLQTNQCHLRRRERYVRSRGLGQRRSELCPSTGSDSVASLVLSSVECRRR